MIKESEVVKRRRKKKKENEREYTWDVKGEATSFSLVGENSPRTLRDHRLVKFIKVINSFICSTVNVFRRSGTLRRNYSLTINGQSRTVHILL